MVRCAVSPDANRPTAAHAGPRQPGAVLSWLLARVVVRRCKPVLRPRRRQINSMIVCEIVGRHKYLKHMGRPLVSRTPLAMFCRQALLKIINVGRRSGPVWFTASRPGNRWATNCVQCAPAGYGPPPNITAFGGRARYNRSAFFGAVRAERRPALTFTVGAGSVTFRIPGRART